MLNETIKLSDLQTINYFCDSMDLPLIHLSIDYHILEINTAFLSIINLAKEKLIAKPIINTFNYYGLPIPLAIQTESANKPIAKITHHANRLLSIEWHVSVITNSNEELIGFLLAGNKHKMEVENPNNKDQQYQYILNAIAAIPGAAYWKDLEGNYVGCNQQLLDIAGLKHEKELKAKSDYDLPWQDAADRLRENDGNVINTTKTHVFEEYVTLSGNERALMMSTKKALFDPSGNPIGMIGTSVNVTQNRCQYFGDETSDQEFLDQIYENKISLSSREIECANWLSKGKSADEIALITNLSRRTVETYINNIKKKMHCYKQFQLGFVLGKYGALLF